jgi:hypothetical protein
MNEALVAAADGSGIDIGRTGDGGGISCTNNTVATCRHSA